MARLTWLVACLLGGCVGSCGEPPGPPLVPNELAKTLSLAVNVPFAELNIPGDSRGGVVPPDDIVIRGPFSRAGQNRRGQLRYKTPVPFRARGLFFHRPQPGMSLTTPNGDELPFERTGGGPKGGWAYDRDSFILTLPPGVDPTVGEYRFRYPRATARERSLNYAMSGTTSPEAFVRTSAYANWDTYLGLHLPAPAVAAWDIEVPLNAEFVFYPGLTEPEMQDGADSDGATLVVEVDIDGDTKELLRRKLTVRSFERTSIDLSAYAEQRVRLRVRTEPGASTSFDYAFLAEPVVTSRKQLPTRVVMIFVDTLRPDHLGTYGYHRDTSPRIDALAKQSVVFESARSVAPWTLPTTRAVVSGRHPELFDNPTTRTAQGMLRELGWSTAMFAGNVYLSANFGMNKDWERHRASLFPSAEETTDSALAWLKDHEGRDSLMLVHYMDPHLPYQEPPAYRGKFAGPSPDLLPEEFHRGNVVAMRGANEDDRQYVRDRYDNNIAYADEHVGRLLDALRPTDIVVFFSDHGEEFWDHGGFEHGHTLFDELLHVPLIIRAPGVKPRRVTEPVSLLDVVPTVLELVKYDQATNLDGVSLVPAMNGDQPASAALLARDIGFGRPLYGQEAWGFVQGDHKYTTTEGRESTFNLAADPGERTDLVLGKTGDPAAPSRARLGPAFGTDTGQAFRVHPSPARAGSKDLYVTVELPGGVRAAWTGADALRRSSAEVVSCDNGKAVFLWHGGYTGTREVYVVSHDDPVAATKTLILHAESDGVAQQALVQPRQQTALGAVRLPLSKVNLPNRSITLTWGIGPIPTPQMAQLDVSDAEMAAELEAMGYVDDDGGKAKPAPRDYEAPTGDAVGEDAADPPRGMQLCYGEKISATADSEALPPREAP